MAKSQREQAETKAIALRDVFLQAQAGILAAEALHPGQPCPVCGSVHHPAPAPLAEHVPSREQVELAEQTAERMRGTEREASQRSGEASAAWTQARRQAEETRQLLDWQGDYAGLDAALTAQEQDIMQILIRCTQQVRSAEQAQQTFRARSRNSLRNSVGSRRRFGNVKALCVPRRIRRSPPATRWHSN